jgi:tetratricopeptide (TPR) repeat protein
MNAEDDRRDEETFASFLNAVQRDMAPPNRAFLDRLGERSTEAYRAAFATSKAILPAAGPTPPLHRRRLGRWVAGLAAAVLAGLGAYLLIVPRPAAAAFGQVLQNTESAGGLHLKVGRQGETDEAWVRGDKIRRDRADGTYEIAKGGRLWVVEEKENKVTPRQSPYGRGEAATIDLLALLGLPAGEVRDQLAKQLPAGRVVQDGAEYLVYRTEIAQPGGKLEVEALANPATLRLHSARARELKEGAAPAAELRVLGYEEQIDERKFVVKDTLTEDGRVGKIADLQGVVSIRPVMHQRWTPVVGDTLLRPGDWVRADVRGANAALLRLIGRGTLTLGPGCLVEVLRPDRIRIHQGEVEADVPAGTTLELVTLGGQSIVVKGRLVYRIGEDRVVRLEKDPLWLKGFKGAVPQESLGSLLAKVDGRNVPLSVGYHKVTVDVRDQIARTTIEESFVNHTDGVLEGVFHFPLPQDASISGFGMWIGDNLVEADVVEKQRAREIYETILTEKRDPGLLEWTGGNVFKARVYPIFGHSEKRIKLTYTQVLPLQGGQYRYSYALQSEMLRQHPLRQLDIDFKVHSALPLRSVTSPTHTTRDDRTEHSAHVEFTAQEYTPTRDFEVVVEVDTAHQPEVVMVPHRRGEDGYFLLQVLPPAAQGKRDRTLLPDGTPLRLLVLADTSASMDASQRARQAAFVAALLGALTPRDMVNLGCCDVDCEWAFDKPCPATSQQVLATRQFLAKRVSLGWTDLDRAFASAFRQCELGTQILYVGDGIVTTADADPVAFAARLRRLHQEQGKGVACHAVALGNSFEPGVLHAIGSLGGGSSRQVSGGQGPVSAAREWLAEATRPALRDLKVEFKGLRTARVYPEELPNLPAGSQQIVLGRYLPEGKDQVGEVVVTGRLGDKQVRYSSAISLKSAEEGNSFIPRLWARMHLDTLLAQGTSPPIRDEIIALSEEYQIITPYTSLLVLESDADRERFGVKRLFKMRDGEKFFAQGRDNANYDLVQQQMKRAGGWRLSLRRQVLRQLATMGRNPQALHVQQAWDKLGLAMDTFYWGLGRLGDVAGRGLVPLSSSMPMGGATEWYDTSAKDAKRSAGENKEFDESKAETYFQRPGDPMEFDPAASDEQPPGAAPVAAEPLEDREEAARLSDGRAIGKKALLRSKNRIEEAGRELYAFRGLGGLIDGLDELPSLLEWGGRKPDTFGRMRGGRSYSDPRPRFDTLFPSLPSVAPRQPQRVSSWPEAAREAARSLLRTGALLKHAGGVEILRQTETFDPHRGRLIQRGRRLELFAPGNWLTRSQDERSATLVHWCDANERGVLSLAFQLGRVRAASPEEARTSPLELSDFSLTSIEEHYAGYTARLEQQGKDRALLVLRQENVPAYETRLVIDVKRKVLLSLENRVSGKVAGTISFDDFVEAAGCWWACKVETRDQQGRRTSLETQTVRELSAAVLRERIQKELAARETAQLLRQPLPRLADAKRALKAGKASFEDRLVLLGHFAVSQRWARALEHLEKAESLASGKPGVRWLRVAFLNVSRRHDELKGRLLSEASSLVQLERSSDAFALAEHLVTLASGVLPPGEILELLDRLRPIYEASPPHLRAMVNLQQVRASYLQQVGRAEEALRIQKQLAIEYPDDSSLQRQYAQALANSGDFPAAYAWLKKAQTSGTRWLPDEEEAFHDHYAALLYQQGQYAELAEFLAAWVKREPETVSPYLQYLSALIRTGQIDKANDVMTRWLREGQAQGERAPAVASRLHATINQAIGRGHNLYTNQVEDHWLASLAEAALVFARRPDDLQFANIIMQSSFSSSDACREVRKKITAILDAEVEKLTPAQLESFVPWVLTDDPPVAPEVWKGVAAALRKRWTTEKNSDAKHLLGQVLAQVLAGRGTAPERIAFLRQQLASGPETHRTTYAGMLFEALLAQPWSAEIEGETLGLLERLTDAADAQQRLHAQVVVLYRLTDTMVEARYTALMAKVEHPEKLARTELKKIEAENRKKARQGFAERLRADAGRHGKELAPWLLVERLYLEVLTERDPKAIVAECWALLGDAPAGADEPAQQEKPLEVILRHRLLTTLSHLAGQKNADAGLVNRLLAYVDKGAKAESDDGRWKLLKFSLLVALDRPKDLESSLRQWSAADDADSRWRVALAYVVAEQGRLVEAAGHFEAVEKDDELDPSAYRALADWYMALNRREAHDRALLAAYKTLDEWAISRSIAARFNIWQRAEGHPPSELDREVLLMFAALFEKSSYPGNYLGQLQQFYQATRDFRLLAVLADAVVGHSAGKVYPFLQGMQNIITDIHDEATVDELGAHIAKVRARARTAVDRRALDLLETQVRRRAAELKNQPGPHAAAALSALKRAFTHPWSDGEPRLMADLLAALGPISQEPLAKEQVRQLEVLHAQAKAGTEDRLHIAHRYASTQWAYGRRPEATDLLAAALKEFQDAHDGVMPVVANEALANLVSFHTSAGQHGRGEKLLRAQLQHPAHHQEALWLTQQLYGVFHDALRDGGEVSLGKGQELYKTLERTLRGELGTQDNNHRHALASILCRVYRIAAEKKLDGVADDLRAFAFRQLGEVLGRQTNDYDSMVTEVAGVVHDVLGPGDGVAFLLDRVETEPAWLRFNNQDGWNRHAWSLGFWRQEAKTLPPTVEARLLVFVSAELRRDLMSGQARNRNIYHRSSSGSHFWVEKEADFVKVAEDVLARRARSSASVTHLAQYFSRGVNRHNRAVEILLAAHKDKLLDEAGASLLVQFLHEASRYRESIAILKPIVETRPEHMNYRVWLMRAYFNTANKPELLALLKDTDAFFHKEGRWSESAMAALAESTLENALHEQSTAYFKEVISLHEQTAPRRGVGDGVLSGYYAGLARAYSGLHKTPEAVEAAASAVVSWGSDQNNRNQAIAALLQVLREAPDLDAYVAYLDRHEAETGLHNALVHKEVGRVYIERARHKEAVTQLRLAAELQPTDIETQQLLVAQYDALRDPEGAFRQLLEAAELSRRSIGLYKEMGKRLAVLGRPGEVERAYTSIVEVLPNESEGHTMLAEIRQEQGRWADAIVHWEQVARIRALEPTGLLKLAGAQIHERQWDQAVQTVKKLRSRGWPARFNNVDQQIHELEQQIETGRK